MNKESAQKNGNKMGVPWWSWPAVVLTVLDPTMASSITGDILFLKKFRLSLIAPLAALSLALLFGIFKLSFGAVYTESFLFLMLAATVGLLLPSLGVFFVLLFSLFDLLRFLPNFSLGAFAGHIVSYWLLWLLVIEIPGIVHDFTNSSKKESGKLSAIPAVISAVLSGVLVFIWTLGEPLLIRPFFTWGGESPSVESVAFVQNYGYVLVIVSFIAALIAGFLKKEEEVKTVKSSSSGLENPVLLIIRYVLPIAFLGGVISSVVDLILLISGVLVARFIGKQFIGTSFYENHIATIPRAYRIVLAFILMLVFSLGVMQLLYSVEAVSEFFPHVLVIAAGFFIFEFLTGEPSSQKMPKSVGLAILVLFCFLFLPKVVHADNCSGRSDCNGTAAGAAAAAAGAGAAAGLGRRGKGKGDGDGKKDKDALDKAKDMTDLVSKMPGAHPLQKAMAKGLLDKIYDAARGISDALQGKTN